ncbi:MAG: MFS transporter [Acholeplasma sp.]|jgi:MFS family permease|nr:MFS transporter [Acholeplasma sp.]
MPKKHTLMIISSILMMLLMGTVYAYSVFRYHIEDLYQISTLTSGLPYMTSLFFYAFSMMVTGRHLKPTRLRGFVFYGTLLIILGYFLSSIATHIGMLVFSYGVLIGTGVGMVYGVPIYMVQKLYPKRSGLMTGIILLGFGMSPLITAPLTSALIEWTSIRQTFFILGVVFLVLQLPLSYIFILKERTTFKQEPVEQRFKEKLKPFKRIYALFVIATLVGLMMIGLTYQVGVRYYGLNETHVTIALSFFAILNGLARPLFGKLMDNQGFKFSGILSVSLIVVASVIGLINRGSTFFLFGISFGLYWFNLGAWLAIVPATIKEFYGIQQYAKKYGLMFTGYGVGAILGTLASGYILDMLGETSYIYGFILALMVISAILLSQMPKKIKRSI